MNHGDKCFCLYVNLTINYVSFKIEEGKYMGRVDEIKRISGAPEKSHVVEHWDDEVNYLSMNDIFETETDAIKGLIKILNNKVEKDEA